MADLSLVPMAICKTSYEGVTFHIGDYTQEVYLDERRSPWCSCKGFAYRRKCKHIDLALETMCDYFELTDGPPEDDKCPKCGGELTYIQVGV